MHTFEGADQEGAGDVGIHGAHYSIGKHGKAEHVINLGMCGNNVRLHVTCGGCIGLVLSHVSHVNSSGTRQMVFDECCSEAGDCGKLFTEV